MTHTNHVIKSERLGKDVNVRVYGTKGYPVIAFPTQDQMADEWEANGMTEVFAPYVDAGRVQLFTVDSNDLESWSNPSDDFAARIGRQEDYYNFVCDELLPFVHQANGSRLRPELTGASLGATQATICALRRPDLFQGVIALSGMYHTSYFFGDWGNDISYANDVNAFLPNTPLDHPYIELYRQRTFAFAIGQADDEQFGVSDLHFLQQTFDRLGISGWFDFWGPESNHDWYWWKQQMAKFLPEAVKELEGVAAAEPELAKAEPKKLAAPAKKPSRAAAAKADKPAAAPKAEASEAKKATTAVRASATKEVAAEKASAPKTKAETAAKKAETAAKEAEPKKTAPAKKVAAATAQAKVAPAKKATTAKPAPVADVKDTAKKAATPAKKATATKVSASKSGSASKASAANKPAAKTTTRKRSATSKSSTSARKTTKKSAK